MTEESRAIAWFADVGKDDVGVAGGKGANLGEMTRARIPVPPGFIVTADAYRRFLEASGLRPTIQKLLARQATPLRGTAPVALEVLSQVRPSAVGQRKPGQFSSPWERRIFVGGSYRHIAILNEIKCVVETNGFDPVLAIDFQIPEGLKEHGHALILLHESKGAIFDLSTEGGQLMEIEHTRDYGIEHLLFVYQGRSDEDLRITDMLKALLRDMGFWPKPYDCMAELRALVEDFLGRLQESAS